MKKALILQYFGLGDCIFSQGIAQDLIAKRYEIVWPVKEEFVRGLQMAYPYINWMPHSLFKPELFEIKQDIERDGYRIIPIRWADSILKMKPHLWMRAKYDLYSLDFRKWKNGAQFNRDNVRESILRDRFGISEGDKFNLVNTMYRTDASGSIVPEIKNDYPIVKMEIMPNFSLFDYSWLIENAAEVHVANSAILYLLEILNFKGTAHIYSRNEEGGGFPYVDYLMTKDYILHT